MSEVITSVITPDDKTLRQIFQNPKCYYIDIYQREYKWQRQNVETLLNDIEVRFNLTARTKNTPTEIRTQVHQQFEPYFLNTFLTNTTSQDVSIVDGQQRLTTFLVLFIKLYRVVEEVTNNPAYSTKSYAPQTLQSLIFETNDFGEPDRFKIFNPNREVAFNTILSGQPLVASDETQERILDNYNIISRYIDTFLKSPEEGLAYDVTKLTYYLTYLLDKLSIVEIKIEKQKNVAMIFEVVNDRGLGLKPYEILKGKLIGNLEGRQKEEANRVWSDLQNKYYNSKISNSTDTELDLDLFFKTFLRAKFANSEKDYQRFEDKYHYEIYRNTDIQRYFGNFEDKNLLYKIVTADIRYFAELYLTLRTSYEPYEHMIFNKLLDQNQQYLLIMSAVTYNDPDVELKIRRVTRKFDQFHTTLRLLDEYDSNRFQQLIYILNKQVRNKEVEAVEREFDAELLLHLAQYTGLDVVNYKTIGDLYRYELFQNARNRTTNFTKYLLMRADRFLSQQIDMPSFANEDLKSLEDRFNKNNMKRYGMHLEHIYANNVLNKKLFTDDNGIFDEAQFNAVRNRLGAVLLLRDKQNLSSSNDTYELKKHDYASSGLIWNYILSGNISPVDKQKLQQIGSFQTIEPTQEGVFPLDAVEIRQRELFFVFKHIWGFD